MYNANEKNKQINKELRKVRSITLEYIKLTKKCRAVLYCNKVENVDRYHQEWI